MVIPCEFVEKHLNNCSDEVRVLLQNDIYGGKIKKIIISDVETYINDKSDTSFERDVLREKLLNNHEIFSQYSELLLKIRRNYLEKQTRILSK